MNRADKPKGRRVHREKLKLIGVCATDRNRRMRAKQPRLLLHRVASLAIAAKIDKIEPRDFVPRVAQVDNQQANRRIGASFFRWKQLRSIERS